MVIRFRTNRILTLALPNNVLNSHILCPERFNEYSRISAKIKKEATYRNMLFEYRGPGLDETSRFCPENVYQAGVINVAGEVGPCVFSNLNLSESSGKTAGKQMSAIFKDQPIPLETFSFGNIKNENLARIWRSKTYWEFRKIFDPDTRLSSEQVLTEMPSSCRTCCKRMVSS